jgi:hypothetical protein
VGVCSAPVLWVWLFISAVLLRRPRRESPHKVVHECQALRILALC